MEELDENDTKNEKDNTTKRKLKQERLYRNWIFRDVYCEWSLGFLSQTNNFRFKIMEIISHPKFDSLILLLILLSTFRLIIATFLKDDTSKYIFELSDLFFNFSFLVEMVFKIIALGFILDKNSYLKDNWNRLDFLIVSVSLFELQGSLQVLTGEESGSTLQFFRVFRMFRTLRPLRFISHNVQMKLVINSLLDSISPIFNVLSIVLIIFFMFSISGMNLFLENYDTCYYANSSPPIAFPNFTLTVTDYLIDLNDKTKIRELCNLLGGDMDLRPQFGFYNIKDSMILSFVLSNTEDWPVIMSTYRSYNEIYGLWFVIFILIAAYFFFNLFIGVMFSCFNDAYRKEKLIGLSDNPGAERWFDYLQFINKADPEYLQTRVPTEGFAKFMHKIVNHKLFDRFIMLVIILNMITLGLTFDESPEDYNLFLSITNLIFTIIFIVEAALKITTFRLVYFSVAWNNFDFFVVTSSLLDLIVSYTTDSKSDFLKSFQIIRVLRVLRVTRVLRLIKSLEGLEKLLQTLRWSLKSLMNIFLLMFLTFCIFAILGYYLYEGADHDKFPDIFVHVNYFFNFENFYRAILLVLRCTTGENWPSIMIEFSKG